MSADPPPIAQRHDETPTATAPPNEELTAPDKNVEELTDEYIVDRLVFHDGADCKTLYRVRW